MSEHIGKAQFLPRFQAERHGIIRLGGAAREHFPLGAEHDGKKSPALGKIGGGVGFAGYDKSRAPRREGIQKALVFLDARLFQNAGVDFFRNGGIGRVQRLHHGIANRAFGGAVNALDG